MDPQRHIELNIDVQYIGILFVMFQCWFWKLKQSFIFRIHSLPGSLILLVFTKPNSITSTSQHVQLLWVHRACKDHKRNAA